MRLFEATLIVLAGQLALAFAVMGGRRPRWANLLPLVLLAPLVAHLALEGARWQMAPAYLVAVGFALEGTVRYVRAPRTDGGAKSAEYRGAVAPTAMGITGFVLLMMSAVALSFSR
jgi:hypothetical protein